MKEFEQYTKPSLIGIAVAQFVLGIFYGMLNGKNEPLLLAIITIIIVGVEIWLVIRIIIGRYLYIKRKDEEMNALLENQQYIISKLKEIEK